MRQLWSIEAAPVLRGLVLAREGGRLLAWDDRQGLHLFDVAGQRLAQRQLPAGMVATCCAGDGQHFAALGAAGQVWMLDANLQPRWEQSVLPGGLAAALDSFGEHLAVADGQGGLHLFDGHGRRLWRVPCSRPLRHLAFAAEAAFVVGSANYGLVICCDSSGGCAWRDAPVAHTGSLSISGDGQVIVLANYSDGLCCYGVARPRPRVVGAARTIMLCDISYDGKMFLTADRDNRVQLLTEAGTALATEALAGQPVALALAPLADWAAVACADGTMQALAVQSS